jgi:Protein of unknown function (DUF1499)
MTEPQIIAAVIVLVILMIFVRFIRRLVFILIRLAIFFVASAVAITGLAILMNNETIFEKPGPQARIIRFLTMNSASTTAKGDGTATCNWELGQNGSAVPAAAETPEAEPETKSHRREKPKPERKKSAEPTPTSAAAASPGASPSATAEGAAAPAENYYDELMTRGFPGISRQQLFELSHQVVDSLGGWKIVNADPHSYTLDCLYTSRIFGFQDDIRITVTPKAEIELCSRSETSRPDSNSWLKFFPGDFGANIAHIKQFYETLEPKMDEVYKEQQEKENAKKPRP